MKKCNDRNGLETISHLKRMAKTELLFPETTLSKNFEIAHITLGMMKFEFWVHWDTMSHTKKMIESNQRSSTVSDVGLHVYTYTQRKYRGSKGIRNNQYNTQWGFWHPSCFVSKSIQQYWENFSGPESPYKYKTIWWCLRIYSIYMISS